MRRAVLGVWLAACGGGGDGAAPDATAARDGGAPDGAASDGAAPDGATPDGAAADGAADAGPDAGARCAVDVAPAPGLAVTAEGAVRGAQSGETWAFLGVPFAAPPTGDRRWRAPAPPDCRDAVLEATRFAPVCPQLDGEAYEGDEDCLYLNVWQPSAATEGPRPVLFFIHGGGNAQGSTSEEPFPGTVLYDGAALAARTGAVVVTTAYRLGYLGFLRHPASGIDGNFGLLDQLAALRWVRANAAAFGADPERVLAFGESAGARNTCALVASPLAAGLFSAALVQSGACTLPPPAQVEAESADLLEAAGCADAACLREKTPEALLRARPLSVSVAGRSAGLQPTIDGHVLTEQPLAAIAAGRHNRVPTVIGANADETAQATPPIATEAEYERLVRALLGPFAGAALARYRAADYPSPREAYIRLSTDAKFVCPARAAARALVAGGSPTWRYFFTHRLENVRRDAYAFHGLELFFVFDKLASRVYRPSAAERALAATIGGYWGALAAHGDPNDEGAPAWPAYDAETEISLVLDGAGVTTEAGIRSEACDFWDELTADLGE